MKQRLINSAVIVSALGYFVDAFDLILFGVVRVKSLQSLGFEGEALTQAGIFLQNWLMAGLLLGGVLSGIVGDKFGRVKVLYGSIALYSIANLANGMVADVNMYALCRFLAGIGLAGEVGTGITLVSESLPKEKRGLGTTIVATFGMMGALSAGMIDWIIPDWRMAYYFGGGLGIILLVLRIRVQESGVFNKIKTDAQLVRGNFLSFFQSRELFGRLLKNTFLGGTTWFVVGILVFLAPEFGRAKGIETPISPAEGIIYFHIGMVLGDVSSGLLSQLIQSRVKTVQLFLGLQTLVVAAYLFAPIHSASMMYILIGVLGFTAGFWAVFITNASEQFGTNLRATAACTIPSLVRGLFIPIGIGFTFFASDAVFGNPLLAAALLGFITLGLAFWSSFSIKDAFHRDLDFVEK
ncbi:MAG: MFS transporter [Saprospiraceae bacterium]|nr:MFS transporter [Saprospiraceae bacterium]